MRDDVIIVGGSFAGLSAAIYLARARRRVRVIDSGSPRNRFASQSHGFFGQDGGVPGAMIAAARAQVEAYPTVSFVDGAAMSAAQMEDGFAVTLATGESLDASILIMAFGISDVLPVIPGVAERWGRSVLHCPYCHGYEFAGRRLGVLALTPRAVQQAMLISEWGPTTLFLNGMDMPDAATLGELERRSIEIELAPVAGLHGRGAELASIELGDGRTVDTDALYLGAPTSLNSTIAAQLGCALEEGASGTYIRTDAAKMTTIPGVYAAGDITREMHNITFATADGVMASTAAHRTLVFGPETPLS